MIARNIRRRATVASRSQLPDDGIVVATTQLALSTLMLMLCAGLA